MCTDVSVSSSVRSLTSKRLRIGYLNYFFASQPPEIRIEGQPWSSWGRTGQCLYEVLGLLGLLRTEWQSLLPGQWWTLLLWLQNKLYFSTQSQRLQWQINYKTEFFAWKKKGKNNSRCDFEWHGKFMLPYCTSSPAISLYYVEMPEDQCCTCDECNLCKAQIEKIGTFCAVVLLCDSSSLWITPYLISQRSSFLFLTSIHSRTNCEPVVVPISI